MLDRKFKYKYYFLSVYHKILRSTYMAMHYARRVLRLLSTPQVQNWDMEIFSKFVEIFPIELRNSML